MTAYPVGNLQVFLVQLQYEATQMACTDNSSILVDSQLISLVVYS